MTDPAQNLKGQGKLPSSLALRLFATAFILFHLSVIVVLANGGSYLGRSLQYVLTPYANFIGLNSTWNFFSPDPAHTMYFKFLIRFDDGSVENGREPVEVFIPPAKDKITIDASKRRLMYAMRFMLLEPRRVNSLLGPWICRSNPGAASIHIEHILEQIPPLDRAIMDNEEGAQRVIFDGQSAPLQFDYDCSATRDEVEL